MVRGHVFLDQFGQDFLPGQDIGEADVFHIDHVFGDPHAEGTGRVADHAGQSAEGRFQGDGAAGGQGRITGSHHVVVVAFHHFHRHRAGFQYALEQGSIDGRGFLEDELHIRPPGPDFGQGLEHHRQHPGDFLHPAARQQQHQRMAGPLAHQGFRLLGAQGGLDDVHQGIPHKFHSRSRFLIDFGGKGIDAGHSGGQPGHVFGPSPAPGPGGRRDVRKHRDAQFFGFFGHPHVEIRIVHGHEHIRFPFLHEPAEGLLQPQQTGQGLKDFHKAHDAVIFIVEHHLAAGCCQGITTHAKDLGRGVLLQDGPGQRGGMKVAGSFPSRNENFCHPVVSSLI